MKKYLLTLLTLLSFCYANNNSIVFIEKDSTSAATQPKYYPNEIFKTDLGAAIKKYDPVAYFTMHQAVKGNSDFTYRWKDATWYFYSSEHRDMFIKNPQKYAPQYGGWCAYAVSKNYIYETDLVRSWTIYNGKLYLNYKPKYTRKWRKKKNKYIVKANRNWPSVLDK